MGVNRFAANNTVYSADHAILPCYLLAVSCPCLSLRLRRLCGAGSAVRAVFAYNVMLHAVAPAQASRRAGDNQMSVYSGTILP
jgi:hypothetical protein